jgi:hypothetical protein
MKSRIPLVLITDVLADRTAVLLDSFASERPSEGVVYWFGVVDNAFAVVTTLVVPDAVAEIRGVRTSVEANANVVEAMAGTPLVLVGQAHSHPSSDVSHSVVDDRETFARFEGAISVVVPWFGRYGFDLTKCGVHRHIGGRFERAGAPHEHLRVVPGLLDFRRAKELRRGHGA